MATNTARSHSQTLLLEPEWTHAALPVFARPVVAPLVGNLPEPRFGTASLKRDWG